MRPIYLVLPVAVIAVLGLISCEDKKPQTIEKATPATATAETSKLGAAVDAYNKAPTAARAADVDRAFAELNQEIAELEQRVTKTTGDERVKASEKAGNLRAYRDKEHLRYLEAQSKAAVKPAAEDAGDRMKEAARQTGEGIKDAAEAVKDGVKNTVEDVKEKLP